MLLFNIFKYCEKSFGKLSGYLKTIADFRYIEKDILPNPS